MPQQVTVMQPQMASLRMNANPADNMGASMKQQPYGQPQSSVQVQLPPGNQPRMQPQYGQMTVPMTAPMPGRSMVAPGFQQIAAGMQQAGGSLTLQVIPAPKQ